ncbi:MAG: class I SAM-dependent methyltransferase [Polaromonas sp.]|uniref:class I SAM-dependent methyltransferase n=1 Tax=Polaromonas sp. TaxID=1869339 RepID=UPI002489241F|nr:class I SAM-dependent methyltransferase [Polaromonas sp.]MDI1270383.1 class I SAM-dependent methyltransferase [Polaromonas sp.]
MTGFSKYLNPVRYLNRASRHVDDYYRTCYRKFIHDAESLEATENSKFEKNSLDLAQAQTVLNKILQVMRGRDFDYENDSIHWLVFSALSISTPGIRNILEIGTFDGEFTSILSRLFPDAKITTVDLPASDPLLRDFYDREEDSAFQRYKKKQAANLANENIKLIETNSFFLLEKTSEKFDLIWVDGGHLYPEVAWDLCSAYHLCASGGHVLCDDVIPLKKLYRDRYVSTESFEVLNYLEARASVQLALFLKRRNPLFFAKIKQRKYVACLKKP